ncbi:cytidine deaminase family protein, partial [Vibrio parahaemolyticus]
MKQKEVQFSYEIYPGIKSLEKADAELLQAARDITENAYAPYSNFQVGAVAKLVDGSLVNGTNQENASFP